MSALSMSPEAQSPMPSAKQSRISPTQPSTLFLAAALRFGGRRRLNEPGYKLFWETVAIIASMLIFSALRPSPTELAARGATQFGATQSARIQTNSIHTNSKESHPRTRSQLAEVQTAREGQLHMARDFTNHSSLLAHTTEKSEGMPNAQGRVIPTRVVLD
jgi:hypothetical protein